jgi:uncharacterized Rossmann fold enzyme
MDCEICGETKAKEEFLHIMHFQRLKKAKVQWCRECQKMYVRMKKLEDAVRFLKLKEGEYKVSFE